MSRLSERFKRGEPFRDASRLIIACEGEKTELEYFQYLRVKHRRSSIRINILERSSDDAGNGSPSNVLDCLKGYAESSEYLGGDQLWAVIDRDRWGDQIQTVSSQCHTQGWHISVNTPCFEVWFALHFLDAESITETNCKSLKPRVGALKDSVSNSNQEFFDYLDSQFQEAYRRASALDGDSSVETQNHILVNIIREA